MAEANPPRSKMRFRRNAASFPGSLHLVLVLRPTSFLQRTFTDIGFRFSQEDFMLKLPVVMLSSVSDLLTYIDEKQLTPELGGTLHYCHREWIIFRNAIENFALTVKEMAQMLQCFGTELAEKELPYDIPAIEEIMAVRDQRYRLLKDNITAVTKEGKFLMINLGGPSSEEDVSSSLERRQPIRHDWQTVDKLLTQVHDMEVAFDGFWEKHQIKMQQYLQLWKFEQDFQELVTEVEFLLSQQAELTEVTETLSEVKQKMQKLDNLHETSQAVLSKAHFMILHGHRLAASHHYALDLICQRCNELRHLSDTLAKEIKTKRIQLSRTLKVHSLIQQARQCCDEGECLLANQDTDKLQSKEDIEKTVQGIKNFLEMALPFLNYDIESLPCEFDVIVSPELKVQMQSIQVKLESIRNIFETQQEDLKNTAEKQLTPIQFVVPTSSNSLTKSRTSLFTPNPGKKTWTQSQSDLKIETVPDCQEKRKSDPSPSLKSDNTLDILKSHVLNELIKTERLYVHELFTVLLGYRAEMDNPAMFGLMPPLLRNKKDILFGNMAEIYEFHNNIFMNSLENCMNAPERVGPCFLERKDDFKIYAIYCQNKPRSEAVWKKFSECAFFQECQRKLKHRLGLDSYLLKPVQRITKYQLLLKELLKYSQDCAGVDQLKEALDAMLDLLKSVNDSMHQVSINGYKGNINDLGKMITQNAFSVWTGHRKGATKMKELARFKPMQRQIFLYEKAIVFCKRRGETGEGAAKYPSYSFKHSLKLEEVGITEYVKGDTRKFEIWCGGKEEVYIVQAPNIDVKLAWLKELRSILLKQQEVLTVQEQLSSQQNYEMQHGAMAGPEEIKSEHSGTLADVGKAIASLQAEANKVLNVMPSYPEGAEGSEEWSSNIVYPSDGGNGEEGTLMDGEIAQQPGAHKLCAEDPGLIPSTAVIP
ncbi:proto-oncogene DBL isoform X1 [Sorex araneus]|uniref:proto-oncogene DBL isoform X1 n=1 Tax=Sorex araneus TaxID=42254 RepID=UPI002433860C|nr:proto-oncogene DBL isoform X1 [Sorex araneus]